VWVLIQQEKATWGCVLGAKSSALTLARGKKAFSSKTGRKESSLRGSWIS